MEDRIKIIYIAPEGITDKKLKNFEERHSATWAEPFSRELIKRWNKIKVEIWKTYDVSYYGHRGVSIRQKEGIKYRMFPAYNLVGTKYFSYQLLKELYAQKRKNRIIVHLQQLHCIMPYCIAFLCSDVPLVAQQRGGSQPPSTMFKFRKYIANLIKNDKSRKRPRFHHLFFNLLDILTINRFDFVFACSYGETIYISKKLGTDRVMLLKGGGFDFSKYKPVSKSELRKELGLPIDKKIILHVGVFTELKGVDVIVDIYKRMSKENDNIGMVFIGGRKDQSLYDLVISSGAVVKEHIPKDEVIKYMNATDVHLLLTQNKTWILFGDIATAEVESLALNQPVVSPLLIHFPGSLQERKQLGIVPNNREEIIDKVQQVLNHPEEFSNTREIMKRYYTWDRIIGLNKNIYDRLYDRYYPPQID